MIGYVVIYSPIITLVVVAFIVSFVSNLLMKLTIDEHKMRNLKERMNKLKKKMKDDSVRQDKEKYQEILNEQYALLHEHMKVSFKSIGLSLIFLLPAYYYLKKVIGNEKFILPFSLPLIGNEVGWLIIYIFYSILFSFLTKKLLKIDY